MINVSVSQKALKAMESLPKDIQVKARRAVEYLKTDNERSVKPSKLNFGRNLFSGRLNDKYRIIYSKFENNIVIVDFIKIDTISTVMRSDV